ncbi:MAG: phosphopentomutase [Candidatus Acidiferrales bacterium]
MRSKSVSKFHRIIWIVLDSVGIGPLPDAGEYGDVPQPAPSAPSAASGGDGDEWRAGRNTLGHIARERARMRAPLRVPNMAALGLGNIAGLEGIAPAAAPEGCYGKGATRSPGKDTTTGHWEMAGIWLDQAFPVYPHGFPPGVIAQFEHEIGRKTIGNKPASGTEIIKELGEEHVRTGQPIVYTSGDSVFQIAAHEDVIPVAELYRMCEIARRLLDGPHRVGRVIARPFVGASAADFRRTERRHDYAVEPPRPMLLDVLAGRGIPVLGVGKVHDIYNGRGVERYVTTKNNADGMAKLREALAGQPRGLIFANLVDFDMLYGHRKDVAGFARSLEEFDAMLQPLMDAPREHSSSNAASREKSNTHSRANSPAAGGSREHSREAMSARDLLIITADHGCDPCPCSPSTDHSREYVPILTYSREGRRGVDLGTRTTLADMGQTVAENFGGAIPHGESFLSMVGTQN